MGVASSVSEILLLSKTAIFPFQPMDYSPWLSKNLIDQNWLKIIMQVGVDVTCMYTNFGGRGLSSFGDTATFVFPYHVCIVGLMDHKFSIITCKIVLYDTENY